MIDMFKTVSAIDGIVLGICEGDANLAFLDVARKHNVDYIVGDETDVLQRLIQCAHKAGASDVFRVTTESPFCYFQPIDEAWQRHIDKGNDVTTTDGLPEGSHFEIYTLDTLETSHRLGDHRHRSESCSLFVREHREDYKVDVLTIPQQLERLDLRLTVDYPEDLVLCRKVYEHLSAQAPRISVDDIVGFLDNHPEIRALVEPFVVQKRLW